ncbi:hypothetical protein C1M55_12055 [Rhodococcus qingshengii]|uniref:hypothetical protein n=1 Tax=Rhodococcus qingshengii TaxID=334542 RepID=UPI000C9F62F5|nr:hypothetical protein [Rhodococcus qingshengii]AUS31768.1 hypothetical protein C1M55_12055 [Rhodococcus qingshengii]
MRVQRSVIAPEPFDMFTRASRWPSRQHPRRDDNGHGASTDTGATDTGTTDTGAATDTGKDADKNGTDTGNTTDDAKDKDIDWKAMSRKHEAEAKKNRDAAAELEKIRASKRTAEEKAQKERDDAKAEAEAARAEAARERAARKYGLSDEDLDFLEGTPADKFDAKAKALSERIKTAAPAGRSGKQVTGGTTKGKNDETDPRKLADLLTKRRY